MITLLRFPFLLILLISFSNALSQNETSKWYFGNNAGLDFMTNPPTILTNGSLITIEGCATISNGAGNLLFYTDGSTVYDQTHAAMANGTGLNGNSSSSQSAIIAKQPGSTNMYYIFTQTGPFGAGAGYSIVDMSLAAGMGSVTVKNMTLSTPCTEKLTSVKHCNGVDIWVIYHDWNSADFKSYLLTSAGLNTIAVISSAGTTHSVSSNFAGCMKTSPNGKKLGLAIYGIGLFEMFDFDNASGLISNPLSLNTQSIISAYGCEFSPDGTKFYGSRGVSNPPGQLFQWDLCAGSPTAIAASLYTVITTNTTGIGAMQRASDGKIYGTRSQQSVLIAINNPNMAGSACNYVELGQSIAPKTSYWSMPNFITSFDKTPIGPFTQTLTCNTASFSLPSMVSGTGAACQGVTYSLTNVLWGFGDPSSGSANSSTLTNPSHTFTSAGTYTAQLILYYSCGGATDTLRQAFTISGIAPTLSVSGVFTICSGDRRIYTAVGANSYSWNMGATSSTISVTPTLTSTYSVVGTTTNGCSGKKTFTVTVNKCAGISETESSLSEALKIFPNPANDLLQIENTEKMLIMILNLQGIVLLKEEYEPGRHQLNLSNLADGIYHVRIITAKGTGVRRLVKTAE